MSAASAASSPGSGIIALMQTYAGIIGKDNGLAPPPGNTSGNSNYGPGNNDSNPATNLQLSDTVKATLAQAQTNQALADQLQGLVAARHAGNSANTTSSTADSQSSGDNSSTDVDKAFAQLSGEDAPVVTSNAPIFTPVEPAKSFSDIAQADGYSLSVTANAKTEAYVTLVTSSDGSGAYNIRFGQSAGGLAVSAAISSRATSRPATSITSRWAPARPPPPARRTRRLRERPPRAPLRLILTR